MKPKLSESDRNRLEKRIVEAEKRTGAQIVLAVIRRSDVYAELPWKAFALGASVSGLAVFITDVFSKSWTFHPSWIIPAAEILGAGIFLAVLAVFSPPFAKLFLPRHRAETEVRQYAESLFLHRELSATSGRSGVLLLVSLFERRVVLYPDKGLHSRLTHDEMRGIIAGMTPFLKRQDLYGALETGLNGLSQKLETSRPAGSGKNELPDRIIEEKGV
jgi:putative membrane protein